MCKRLNSKSKISHLSSVKVVSDGTNYIQQHKTGSAISLFILNVDTTEKAHLYHTVEVIKLIEIRLLSSVSHILNDVIHDNNTSY